METLKEYHYTYYSYEEWGRGYFGSRTCRCLPEEVEELRKNKQELTEYAREKLKELIKKQDSK